METFDNLTLRNIVYAIKNTRKQICKEPVINDSGRKVKLHLGLLQLLVILRRIGLNNNTIISDFAACIQKQNEEVMAYFCSYIALCKSSPSNGFVFSQGLYDGNNIIEYRDLKDNGVMGYIQFRRQHGPITRTVDFSAIITKMLDYIAI